MANNNNKNTLNVPNLRFKGFQGEWEEKKLGEVCRMQAGKFINASEIFDKQNEDLFPCYGGNGLRGYTESFNHNGIYSLIGRQGALCGNVTLANGKFHATEHAIVVRPEKSNDTIWMFYLLSSLNLNQYATGQAQPGLSVQNLEKIETILPESKAEQIKIGAFLSLLDLRIEAQIKIIEKYESLIKGLSVHIFSNQIQSKIRLGDLLKEYSEKNISNDLAPVAVGKFGIRKREDIYSKDLSDDYSKNKVIMKDTMTIGMGSTQIDIGVLCEDKRYCVSPAYTTYKIKNISSKYLEQFLICINPSLSNKYMIAGARQGKSVDKSELLNHRIAIHSKQEQIQISELFCRIEEKLEMERHILKHYTNQKKYLLSNMFI